MDEATAKAQVLTYIREASGGRSPVVTAELTLGRSSVRADLAVLADEELIGIEIKTERDTLRRLPAQLDAYARFFDHVVVVAAPNHLRALEKVDLRGASVWTIEGADINVVRVGEPNVVTPSTHLELMTREEKKGITIDTAELVRAHYCNVFGRRYEQTSRALWRNAKGRTICPGDVRLLSRFTERREAVMDIARQKEESWQSWREAYSRNPVGCSS